MCLRVLWYLQDKQNAGEFGVAILGLIDIQLTSTWIVGLAIYFEVGVIHRAIIENMNIKITDPQVAFSLARYRSRNPLFDY